jgi:hypothetical protein
VFVCIDFKLLDGTEENTECNPKKNKITSIVADNVTFHTANIADLILSTSCNIHASYLVKQRSEIRPGWMTLTFSTYLITSCKKGRLLKRLSNKFQKLSAEFRRQCQEKAFVSGLLPLHVSVSSAMLLDTSRVTGVPFPPMDTMQAGRENYHSVSG